MSDALGDRMKLYEQAEAGRRAMPLLPVCVRVDGRCFSSWTRGLQRPFDQRLSKLMVHVTFALVEETGALVGYTQSDEISLVLHSPTAKSELWFGGKFQKIASAAASTTTARFNDLVADRIPERAGRPATFDARAWAVPNLVEAANVLVWREIDATKNSVSMAAREHFSHKELLGKGRADMMDMLMSKGVNWNDYPTAFKRGTYVRRVREVRCFSADEIEKLPAKHRARTDPEMQVERGDVRVVDMPPITKVADKVALLFGETSNNGGTDE